jgi:hypothetical protein
MQQASIAALKTYFLGDDARNRVIRFLGRFALYGTFWSIKSGEREMGCDCKGNF